MAEDTGTVTATSGDTAASAAPAAASTPGTQTPSSFPGSEGFTKTEQDFFSKYEKAADQYDIENGHKSGPKPEKTGDEPGFDTPDDDLGTEPEGEATGEPEKAEETQPERVNLTFLERRQLSNALQAAGFKPEAAAKFLERATNDEIEWAAGLLDRMRGGGNAEQGQPGQNQPRIAPSDAANQFVAKALGPIFEKVKAEYGEGLTQPLSEAFSSITGEFAGALNAMQGALAQQVEQIRSEYQVRADHLEWELNAQRLATQYPVLGDKKHVQSIQQTVQDMRGRRGNENVSMADLMVRAARAYISEMPEAERRKFVADTHRQRSAGMPTTRARGSANPGKGQAGPMTAADRELAWARENIPGFDG